MRFYFRPPLSQQGAHQKIPHDFFPMHELVAASRRTGNRSVLFGNPCYTPNYRS